MMNGQTIPQDYRGFEWHPGTEYEVICMFGALLNDLDIPLAIREIRAAFPDCIAIRTDTHEEVKIEFELYSGNFRQHGHDCSECDLIVCWEDTWSSAPDKPKVIALS